MRAIMYNPDDLALVCEVGGFLNHLTECERCAAKLDTDPVWRGGLASMIGALNRAMGLETAPDDHATALDLCMTWMRVHDSLSMADMLIVHTREGEPTDGDRPTKH